MKKLEGLVAAAFTPFKAGKVNVEVIPGYADYLVANGIAGVFVNGTTGEGNSLTLDERIELAEVWLRVAPPGLKVIVHVGHNSLPDCCAMAGHAQEYGAWAVSAMAPAFFKPTLTELVDFAATIASAAPELPFYYYHMPLMSGLSYPMMDFLSLAEAKIPNLAGAKFTHENLMDFTLCLNYAEEKYDMVFGRDEILLCAVSLGARAGIGSTYNFCAPLYLGLLEAICNKEMEKARLLQLVSMRLVSSCVRASPRGLPAIRALTQWRSGLDFGAMRAPISSINVNLLAGLMDETKEIADGLLSIGCGEHVPLDTRG